MGKRAAVAAASPLKASKGGKAARLSSPQKAEEPKSPAENLAVALQEPLAELFAESAAGNTTANMLCAAMPFAVAGAKDQRHPNQVVIIASISDALSRVENARQTDVASTKAEIAKHAESCKTVAVDLGKGKSAAAACKDTKEQKASAKAEAEKDVQTCKTKVDEQKELLSNQTAEIANLEAEKQAFETLQSEAWAKLKAGEFDKKAWRERNNVAKQVMKLLGTAALPASLGAALDIVLKTRPEERGPFAAKTLEHGDTLLASHIALLVGRVSSGGAAAEQTNLAIAGLETALKGELDRDSKAIDAHIEADNAWAAAETHVYELGEVVKRGEPRAQELESERQEKSEILSDFQALKMAWAALVDPPPPVVIEVEELDEENVEEQAADGAE